MPRFDAGKLIGLIDHFYEAAALPELWRDVLAEFADALGATGSALVGGPDTAFEPICSVAMDEVLDFGQRNGWLEKNIRTIRRIEAFLDGHEVVTESMLFTEWELDHLPFNAEFVNRFRYRWFTDMVIAGKGSSTIILSAQRQVEKDPFSRSEITTLLRFAPHIRRAGDLALRLAQARHEGAMEALERFDCGAILLDAKGRLMGLNSAAEALLGPALMFRSRKLTAADPASDAALQGMIGSVIPRISSPETCPVGPVTVVRQDGRPLVVSAVRLARSAIDLFDRAVAIVMISDPDARSRPLGHDFSRAFGFTDLEASIGAALCDGHDAEAIAGMHRFDTRTLRNLLKSMQFKTRTRHHAELVSLLTRYVKFSH